MLSHLCRENPVPNPMYMLSLSLSLSLSVRQIGVLQCLILFSTISCKACTAKMMMASVLMNTVLTALLSGVFCC